MVSILGHMIISDKQSKVMASSTSGSEDEYNFLAEPDSALLCVICLEVAEEPWQHGKCGRLLCKECLEKHGRDKPCPNCRMQQPQYFEDNKSRREIKALQVKCSNLERVCEWEGTVGTLEQHVMATCKFTLVPCPKNCKDDNNEVKHFMRKDLDKHLEKDCPNREYECEHCGEKGTYAHITEVHDDECKKKKLPCTNAECAELIERQHVDAHVLSKCLYTVIACKYKGIGCEAELKRKDTAAHEQDDKLHLHMAIDAFNLLERKVNLLNKESIKFALPEYQKKKEAKEQFISPPFYTSPNGYYFELRVDANGSGEGEGTHVSVHAPLLKRKYDAGLKWPFIGNVTVTLLNQLQDKNHYTYTIPFTAESNAMVGDGWVKCKFIAHSELAYSWLKNAEYLKDDTLYFRVSAEVANRKPWLECTAP